MSTEADLIRDLEAVGVSVKSVWDLVNGPNNYEAGLQVLLKHLKMADSIKLKEGIVRALGVPGFKDAAGPLIEEFKNSDNSFYKWAVANSISIIAPREFVEELMEIMSDSTHGSDRQMIADALGRIGDPRSVPVLLEALEDKEIAGHVVIALGKIGDPATIKSIKPFTEHTMRWIRNAAKKAIERIERRRLKALNR